MYTQTLNGQLDQREMEESSGAHSSNIAAVQILTNGTQAPYFYV